MKPFSFFSDIIIEKLRECCVWEFSFKGNKRDIVNHDGETMSVRLTLSQTNPHIAMLTDMSLNETPDVFWTTRTSLSTRRRSSCEGGE